MAFRIEKFGRLIKYYMEITNRTEQVAATLFVSNVLYHRERKVDASNYKVINHTHLFC